MSIKNVVSIGALLASTVLLTACPGGGSGGSKAATTPVTTYSCPAGNVWVAQFNNYFPTVSGNINCGAGYGYVQTYNQCFPGTACSGAGTPVGGPNTPHLWAGNLNVTNNDIYRSVLKDAGVCDYAIWANWMNLDCNSWDDLHSVMFEFTGSTIPGNARVTIVAGLNPYYSDPYGNTRNITFGGTASPINGNSAFELRSLGTMYGYNKIFIATSTVSSVVVNGSLVQQIRLNYTYNNTAFGYSDLLVQY